MSTSYRTSRRWTEREARAALSALASSGLSQSAFAAREGLDVQRLRLWRRKLGESSAPRFIEVRPRAIERVEVVLRSGLLLRVPESMEPSVVRCWVDALDDVSPC
jgi:hypothetical protein